MRTSLLFAARPLWCLVISDLGQTALAAGDRFPLFSASSYARAFTSLTLPLTNWVNIATNQFGPGGGFTFTNAIVPPTAKVSSNSAPRDSKPFQRGHENNSEHPSCH